VGSPVTFEAWVQLAAEPSGEHLINRFTGGYEDQGIAISPSSLKPRGWGFTTTPTPDTNSRIQVMESGEPVNTERWYHVAASFGAGRARFFVDGRLMVDRALTPPIANKTSPLLIGGAERDTVRASVTGYIAEVRWSSTVLYTKNFTPSARLSVDPATTVALFHLDDGPKTVQIDGQDVQGVEDVGPNKLKGQLLGATSEDLPEWKVVAGP
jgi:hypothetical protein